MKEEGKHKPHLMYTSYNKFVANFSWLQTYYTRLPVDVHCCTPFLLVRIRGVRHCVGIVNKFPERCGKAAFFQNRALIS